ncbi:hypothetical protein QJQ45_008722 [Haematococcus lacustris]|nr:hypothetical protein QJQ45_008722 [Haematococcus lacustris]
MAQRRAAEAEAKAQAGAAEAETQAQADAGAYEADEAGADEAGAYEADAGAHEAEAQAQADARAYEAQLHQLQPELQQSEQQATDTQRLQHLQQQLQDLQQDELQRKEQQVAEQQQQLQQQQADMHLREQQLAEQQHQLQQQQADMHLREQQVAQQQQQVQRQQADLQMREQQVAQQHHQVQQQQADLQLREQQVATQKHQVQQQQADLQQREQQVAQQHHQVQLQQQLYRLQQQLEAHSGAELQRQVQQQLAAQQHLLQQQQADLLLKQQQVEKQPQEASVQQAVSTHHPLPDHSTCSPLVPGSLRSPLLKRPRQDTTLAPMPRLHSVAHALRIPGLPYSEVVGAHQSLLLATAPPPPQPRPAQQAQSNPKQPPPSSPSYLPPPPLLRPVLAGIKPAPGGQRSTNQQPLNTALIMVMGRGIEQHGIKRTARQLGITPHAVKRARRSHLSNLAAGAAADWAAAPLRRGRRCLSQEQLEYVRTFFEEHSSPSPMYKDVRRYYVRMTAGSSEKSEVRMSRRYVDRSLKKLYLEYARECPANLTVGSTTFEMLRPPWVKRITAAHKQVCVCIPCESCELQLDQLGKHMDSLVLPEDPQPLGDSNSDSGSDSDGGDTEVHVVLAEHIANADAQDLAGVLDAGALGEGGLEKLVGDAQNARAAAGAIGGGVATTGGATGGADVKVDLDCATVQSWFVCPCKVGAKPRLACLQRQCAACKDRKVGVKAGCEGVQLQYREFKKLDNGQGVELATVHTTLGELVLGFNALMQKQLWHQYLAKHQRATFRAHCAAVRNTPGLVVVSCDWSEKLTIHQDIACQGAYWKQRTMSVFVACAHYQDMAGNYREECWTTLGKQVYAVCQRLMWSACMIRILNTPARPGTGAHQTEQPASLALVSCTALRKNR